MRFKKRSLCPPRYKIRFPARGITAVGSPLLALGSVGLFRYNITSASQREATSWLTWIKYKKCYSVGLQGRRSADV